MVRFSPNLVCICALMRQKEKSITSFLSEVKNCRQRSKGYFSLKTLLVLQMKAQNHHSWSVESPNHATYRVCRDKGQTFHKGHQRSLNFTREKNKTLSDFVRVCFIQCALIRQEKKSITPNKSEVRKRSPEVKLSIFGCFTENATSFTNNDPGPPNLVSSIIEPCFIWGVQG